MRSSGRFAEATWSRSQSVRVTTLDALIERHGVPAFCKMMSRGTGLIEFYGVCRALCRRFPSSSPRSTSTRPECLSLLENLGSYEFNFALNELLSMREQRWLDSYELMDRLRGYAGCLDFGDLYARLRSTDQPDHEESARV